MERTDPDQWKQWTMIGEFTLRTGQVLEDQARSEELPDGVPGMAFSDARREAVRKAAASLGVAPLTAAVASWQTWGRGLTRERDDRLRQRLEGRDDAQTLRERQRRAMLGHVTRGLLDELRDRVVGVQQDLEERGLIEAEEEG